MSTASSAYTDLKNDQEGGWGFDFTYNYSIAKKNNIYFYYRFWDIDKSKVATGTYANILQFEAYEPANETIEYGIGYSWSF